MSTIINTEIQINAPIETVWDVLTDFDHYPNWNPFIKSISGKLEVGKTLKVTIQPPNSGIMRFKPRILELATKQKIKWLGHLLVPGIFDGKHSFELIPVGDGRTRFVQSEEFKGLLVPLMASKLNRDTRKGFEEMNQSLKTEAEKMFSK